MNQSMVKKELRESLYESKGLWMIAAVSVILTALCILATTIREASAFSQTDVLQYAIKAVLFLTLMVCMVLGASSFVAEREENTLESLLLTPISKLQLTLSKYVGSLLIGFVLLLVSVPYILAISAGSGLTASALFISFFCGLLTLLAFTGIAVMLSVLLESTKASILTSVLILLVLTFPAFLKGILKLSAVGRFFLSIDPIACCFNLMEKMLVDQVSVFSLMQYVLPLLVFAAIGIALLVWGSGKVSLKGEK